MADKGEGKLLVEQIKEISRDLLEDMMEADDRLAKLEDYLSSSVDVDKERILNEIREIRIAIGALEREDTEEIKEEEILESMIDKLNSLIEMTLG